MGHSPDVLVVGAGPAGCVAATVLARAGVRVVMVDRARFPRDKLCGDSVNPGVLALLRGLRLDAHAIGRGTPVRGMILTGDRGASVSAPYPAGVTGRVISRREFDAWLLDQAIREGVEFEEECRDTRPIVSEESQGRPLRVRGAAVRTPEGREREVAAPVMIAADGRRSLVAFGLGLARHPSSPRRWAIGAYFSRVCGLSPFGEIHVRAGHYFGVAPLPGGLANACLVTSDPRALARFRDGSALLVAALAADPHLRDRFAGAELASPAMVLGPLAVDVRAAGLPGLLLAGDAAGFVDPITGDGLRFAIQGAELAAQAALRSLGAMSETGVSLAPHAWLAAQRSRHFTWKRRFDLAMRTLVGHPAAVSVVSRVTVLYPFAIRRLVHLAGDVRIIR